MIVKVQLSISSNVKGKEAPGARVLVYDRDRKYMFEDDASPQIDELMKGRLKAFFHAHIDEDNMIIIDREAPFQDW